MQIWGGALSLWSSLLCHVKSICFGHFRLPASSLQLRKTTSLPLCSHSPLCSTALWPRNIPGSKLGQSLGSYGLFPFPPRLLSFVALCQKSWQSCFIYFLRFLFVWGRKVNLVPAILFWLKMKVVHHIIWLSNSLPLSSS